MTQDSKPTPPPPAMNLSNLQVTLILLAVGVFLVIPTWFFAKDIGRIPVSLWDICTTILPSDQSKTPASTSLTTQTPGTQLPASPQKPQ